MLDRRGSFRAEGFQLVMCGWPLRVKQISWGSPERSEGVYVLKLLPALVSQEGGSSRSARSAPGSAGCVLDEPSSWDFLGGRASGLRRLPPTPRLPPRMCGGRWLRSCQREGVRRRVGGGSAGGRRALMCPACRCGDAAAAGPDGVCAGLRRPIKDTRSRRF